MPLHHRFIHSNGIRMHLAEQGEGPLVLLCHGFPESWYSWRHQLPALAEAGFRAVAPDMRQVDLGAPRRRRPEHGDRTGWRGWLTLEMTLIYARTPASSTLNG